MLYSMLYILLYNQLSACRGRVHSCRGAFLQGQHGQGALTYAGIWRSAPLYGYLHYDIITYAGIRRSAPLYGYLHYDIMQAQSH